MINFPDLPYIGQEVSSDDGKTWRCSALQTSGRGIWDLVPTFDQYAAAAAASADDAAASAAAAATDAISADAARVLAEQARDSVVLASGIKATITIGRGSVADGQYFLVMPNVTDGLTRTTLYRRDSSTTQTKITDYGTGEEIDALQDMIEPSVLNEWFSVRDNQGFSVFVGNDEGFGTADAWVGVDGLLMREFEVVPPEDDADFGVRDPLGFYSMRYRDGVLNLEQGISAAAFGLSGRTDAADLVVRDALGFHALHLENGVMQVGAGYATPKFEIVTDPDDAFGVRDSLGFYLFRVTAAGQLVANVAGITALQAEVDALQDDVADLDARIDAGEVGIEPEPMVLIAHRGFRLQNTENTLLAWSKSIAAGADGLETDVSVSASGTLYCFHDVTVDALTTGTGTFTALADATIDALRFDANVGTPLADVPIARFADMLAYAKSVGATVYPEFKGLRNTTTDVDAIVQAVIDAGMLDRCFFQSFSLVHLQRARAYSATAHLSFITSDGPNWATYAANVLALGGPVGMTFEAANTLAYPAMIAFCKANRIDLQVWTVNSGTLARQLMRAGVKKIMSDVSLKAVL